MGNVLEKFIKPLMQVFSPPKTENTDQWLRAYDIALSSFSDEALAKGADLIIVTRMTRTFPLPAECSISVKEAINAMAAQDRRVGGGGGGNSFEILNAPLEARYPECNDRRRIQADRLFAASGYSHEALKEDWAWALHDWFRKHERQPDKYEVEKIREKGMGNSREFWGMVGEKSDTINPSAKALIKWRRTAMDRLKGLIDAPGKSLQDALAGDEA